MRVILKMAKKIKSLLRSMLHWYKNAKLIFRKPHYEPKIFCIGYNKTGTTSLGRALIDLGYQHSSFNQIVWRKYYQRGKIDKVLKYTAKFESFDDLPWLEEAMIPILDKHFPGSKFIYLERDEASWKKSIYNWTYQMTGKYPDINQKFTSYKKHRRFVLDYFKNRSSDQFIILNIKDEKGFKKLADFVGRPSLQDAFPHYNKTQSG